MATSCLTVPRLKLERAEGGSGPHRLHSGAGPADALPESIPLTILYEDPHLIVIDKPARMVVHPAPGHRGGTLVNALLHHCQDLSGIGGELRPGIVHRLDKDTSGVMVATKDDRNASAAGPAVQGAYRSSGATGPWCTVWCQTQQGTIDRPIGRHPAQRLKMSSSTPAGRRAVTHWQVLRRYRPRSPDPARPDAGNRPHPPDPGASGRNEPAGGRRSGVRQRPAGSRDLADPRAAQADRSRLDRQFLHAWQLGFVHPATGELHRIPCAAAALNCRM